MRAATHFHFGYCTTVYTSAPLHNEGLLAIIYRLGYDDEFLAGKFVVFDAPFAGGYDVLCPRKITESPVFQIIIGRGLEPGCDDTRIGFQQIIGRVACVGCQRDCQFGQLVLELQGYRFGFIGDSLRFSYQEVTLCAVFLIALVYLYRYGKNGCTGNYPFGLVRVVTDKVQWHISFRIEYCLLGNQCRAFRIFQSQIVNIPFPLDRAGGSGCKQAHFVSFFKGGVCDLGTGLFYFDRERDRRRPFLDFRF